MTYPSWNKIREIAESAGGHRPDAIAPAVCFDRILWDEANGELWIETRIASDFDNNVQYHDGVHCLCAAWNEHPTADKLISEMAFTTCPHFQNTTYENPGECPCSESGMPVCDMPPLCRHVNALKHDIIFKHVKTADT